MLKCDLRSVKLTAEHLRGKDALDVEWGVVRAPSPSRFTICVTEPYIEARTLDFGTPGELTILYRSFQHLTSLNAPSISIDDDSLAHLALLHIEHLDSQW